MRTQCGHFTAAVGAGAGPPRARRNASVALLATAARLPFAVALALALPIALALLVAACAEPNRPPAATVAAAVAGSPPRSSSTPRVAPTSDDALLLEFGELLASDSGPLRPSEKLQAANGKRVRVVGFMAQMEVPPPNGFYLTRRPVSCDEGGAGIGDLPPDAIRVLARTSRPSPAMLPYVSGRVEVRGTLELGPLEEPDGTISRIRIFLGEAPPSARPKIANGGTP